MRIFPKILLALMLPLPSLLPSSASAQPGAFNPPLLECGAQGEAQVICGTRAPEDFELSPDGSFLIVAKYGKGDDLGLDLFDLASQRFTEMALSSAKQEQWGMAACTESIGAQVSPHGLSLSQRSDGRWQLYVVNHNVRESMEMYELLPAGESWRLVWRGCVLADQPYNDVAALPDGSFVATRPQAIQQQGQDLFAGAPTGNVAHWTPATGEQVLPGSDYGFPNGVLVSADGRYAYVSGWTTRSFHQYDLMRQQEVGRVDFTFMPDNLTWTPDGRILAAGIKGINGNCPADSAAPCLQGLVVAEVDPATLGVSIVYDNAGKALINGTSVAIEAGGFVYVGSFQGTRLVKLPR
ncbi:MAG: SMP-30/gluconolactonase/LRE family protein [Pseudomonadales bacterium]|nr:SMP-30/gluconolactonase/LRE family protein [Pseudomonadales bacterium]